LTASGLVEIKIKKIKEGMNSGRLEDWKTGREE